MLDNEPSLLGVEDEPLDDLGSHQPLLRVKVGGRLVDKVDVCRFAKAKCHGHALQLSARKVLNLLVNDIINP